MRKFYDVLRYIFDKRIAYIHETVDSGQDLQAFMVDRLSCNGTYLEQLVDYECKNEPLALWVQLTNLGNRESTEAFIQYGYLRALCKCGSCA